jgi:hypothetical protein
MDLSGMHEKQQEVVIQDCDFDSIHTFDYGDAVGSKLQGLELETLVNSFAQYEVQHLTGIIFSDTCLAQL